MKTELAPVERRSLIDTMAAKYNLEPKRFLDVIRETVMPSNNKNASNEQLAAFLLVANRHKLDPFAREIFAFPARGGGIQPVVSVDGWLRIANEHPQFDGLSVTDINDDHGQVEQCRVELWRKDRSHPIVIHEYLSECKRDTEHWKNKPRRMLRHKAVIQAIRYAFSLSGIMDPDEAETILVQPDREPHNDGDDPANIPKLMDDVQALGVSWAQAGEEFEAQFSHSIRMASKSEAAWILEVCKRMAQERINAQTAADEAQETFLTEDANNA